MRLDHILIHTDNDAQKLQAIQDCLNPIGYPFDPNKGKRSSEFQVSNVNIGAEYLEIVRITRPDAKTWMPLWTRYYDEGRRGAYCIFIEVEDVERTAVAIKKAGIRARGPAVIPYPALFGLLRVEAPYFIYYMPAFPDATLHLALMQYKKPSDRQAFQSGLAPNALENGINGIRRVEVRLPNLSESMDMIGKILGDPHLENNEWTVQMDKTRMAFVQSADEQTHIKVTTVTSQKDLVGKKFEIENVEVVTGGG